MVSLRKTILGRLGFGGMSMRRTWMLVLSAAMVLVLVEFRYLWQQTDSEATTELASLQETLRQGLSHTNIYEGLNDPRGQPKPAGRAPLTKGQGQIEVEQGQDSQAEEGKPSTTVVIKEGHLTYVKGLAVKPHDKWIVLDTAVGVCPGRVTAPPGWSLLLIGDAARVQGCNPPTCNYIHPPDWEDARTEEDRRLLLKTLAYLTAISRRAMYLLDADCRADLQEAVNTLTFPSAKDHGPMYNDTVVFNPYAHFGAWEAEPRAHKGHALGTGRASEANSRVYYVREYDSVLVKHGLSDKSDDVVVEGGDASSARLDHSTPPVFLGQHSFSLAAPVATMYRQKALWSLLMPCPPSYVRCHVLRQLMQQRMLREMDAFSGFYLLANASRSSGPPLRADRVGNLDKLVLAMDMWMCQRGVTLLDCLGRLSEYLLRGGHVDGGQHALITSWASALKRLAAVSLERVSSPWRGVRKTSEVRVQLSSMTARLQAGGRQDERRLETLLVDDLRARCNSTPGSVEWFPVAQWRKPLIEDIVLIVVFNWNRFFWNNLPFLETMHRPFFKHIVYCVPNMTELTEGENSDLLRHVTLVEGLSDTWYFMYECVTIVATMNFQGVRGYLQIGDDTLINTALYFNAPRDAMWIPNGFTTMRADEEKHSWGWYWWKKSRGRPAFLQAMADVEHLSHMTPDQILRLDPSFNKTKGSKYPFTTFTAMHDKDKASFPRMRNRLPGSEGWAQPSREEAVRFLKNYYSANRLIGRVKHRAMDFFYIPQVLIEEYVKFSRFFLSHNVLIELALPTIHYGLAAKSDVKYVSASSLWHDDRKITYTFYDENNFFLHPFKMKSDMDTKLARDFFCADYMKILFSELKKRVKS